MKQSLHRSELALFLRGRRERLAPHTVGLPKGARRRTPGLRRQEVAQLAEVGVDWYTWIEQGRDIQVSEAVLDRLSRALRLDHTERCHLFDLAHGRPVHGPALPLEALSEALRHTIDAHPNPVVVSTPRWDVVALNAPALALWGDRRGMNSLRMMFAGAPLQPQGPETSAHARKLVARFRYEAGRAADRTPFDELASELAERSPEFRAYWESHELLATPDGVKVVRHPQAGDIELVYVTLLHVEPDGTTLRVAVYTPRDDVSMGRARAAYAAPVGGEKERGWVKAQR